jgi:hypothetical protein
MRYSHHERRLWTEEEVYILIEVRELIDEELKIENRIRR